jgi:protein-S-isoprenylcysteine O-methyltransferase Ste14
MITFGALMFWIISRVQLGSSFSLIPEAKEIVTNGIYSKIRHPIYFFTLIANLGVIYLLDNKYLYLLMPIFIIVQYIRIQKEEYLLTKKFGNKYLDYKKSTWF